MADLGFLASYEHHFVAGKADAVEFVPLIEQATNRFTHRINAAAPRRTWLAQVEYEFF